MTSEYFWTETVIVYQTLTGNSRHLALKIKQHLILDQYSRTRVRLKEPYRPITPLVGVAELGQFAVHELKPFENVVLVIPTYGDGKLPREMKRFLASYSQECLVEKRIILVGTGLTNFHKFCGALDGARTILEHHKCQILHEERIELTNITDEQLENIVRACRGEME